MRGYGPNAAVGMAEVYEIAEASGVAAHVSHYNGPADLLLPLIDQGRALGLDLTFDTYPYLAGSTILGMVALPPWVQEGGIEPTVERLADPTIRARLNAEWFSTPTPYPLDTTTIAMVGEPRLAMGRGADGRPTAAEQARLAAGRLRLRDPARLGDGRRHRRLPRRRTDRGRRPRDPPPPRAHGGLRRDLLRRLPPPARLGGVRPLPRLPHPRARRLHLARGRSPTWPRTPRGGSA